MANSVQFEHTQRYIQEVMALHPSQCALEGIQ